MGFVFAYRKSSAQPEFTSGAAITGTAQVGQTLTCNYTVIRAKPSNVTVRWYSYNADGTGELLIGEGATYTLTGNEFQRRIGVKVNASNPAGIVASVSALTDLVIDSTPTVPVFTGSVTISGQAEIGETLTANYSVSGYTSLAVEWRSYTNAAKANPETIGTSNTQAVTFSEDQKYIDVIVSAYDSEGNAVVVSSDLVGPVQPDTASAPEILAGAVIGLDTLAPSASEGEYLVCDFAFSGHASDPTVAWYKCTDAAKTGATVLAGAGTAVIQPRPVSEPNVYRAALFLDQSLGLHAAGNYVYAVASATNGSGTTPSETDAIGPIGAIVGTPIAQSDLGDGSAPLKLDTSGTYYLSENLTADGTCLAVAAENVIINLNGKTVTFSDDDAIDIEGGFETYAGWDFTPTGNASAGVGAVGGAEYAAISTGSSEQVAYNSGVAHSGVRSLFFGVPACADNGVEHYVKSTEFTCRSDKWYSVGFMAKAHNTNRPDIFVRLRDAANNLIHTWQVTGSTAVTMFQKSWRYCEFVFKASATPATYYLEVGVRGRTGVTNSVRFDDIHVSRGRTAGVAVGAYKTTSNDWSTTVSWDQYYGASNQFTTCDNGTSSFTRAPVPDVAWDALAAGCVIKNGTISQGESQGAFAAGVMFISNSATLLRLNIATNGPTSSAARTGHWGHGFSAYDCDFAVNHKTCGQREYYYGAALFRLSGSLYRCTVRENAAVGILPTSAGITLEGCTFRSKERYTNQFAIELYNGGPVSISDCTIDNLGEYYGRGIHTGAGSTGVIYNNRFSIQQSSWNPEYNGYINDAGAYALQAEGTPGVAGLDIYGNTLYAYAGGSYLSTAPTERDQAQACRPKDIYGAGLLRIYSNVMIAEAANGTAQAWCYSPSKCAAGAVVCDNNIMQTNSGLMFVTECKGVLATNTSIIYDTREPASWPITIGFTRNYSLANPAFTIDLRDSTFNALAETTLYAEKPRSYVNGSTALNPNDPDQWNAVGYILISWTITIDAGEAGAAVTITNAADEEVASGTTDEFGMFAAAITEQRSDVPNGIQTYNDHTASVVSGDLARTGSAVFTADATKTVPVVLA